LQVHEAVARACRPLRKLRLLLDVILDAPMKQVVAMWERHELQVRGRGVAVGGPGWSFEGAQ